jgi:hypothetical protein
MDLPWCAGFPQGGSRQGGEAYPKWEKNFRGTWRRKAISWRVFGYGSWVLATACSRVTGTGRRVPVLPGDFAAVGADVDDDWALGGLLPQPKAA